MASRMTYRDPSPAPNAHIVRHKARAMTDGQLAALRTDSRTCFRCGARAGMCEHLEVVG